jgi:hypothetical protein
MVATSHCVTVAIEIFFGSPYTANSLNAALVDA